MKNIATVRVFDFMFNKLNVKKKPLCLYNSLQNNNNNNNNNNAFITAFDISNKSHKQANNDKTYKKTPWILRKKIKYKKK